IYTPFTPKQRLAPTTTKDHQTINLDDDPTTTTALSSSSNHTSNSNPNPNPDDTGEEEAMDPIYRMNVDAAGKALPHDAPHSALARRIAPFGELFFFDYGVVVMWGLTEAEERELLGVIRPFEEESLVEDDIEIEEFHFHYNTFYQPRIYHDVITLKNPANYMIKLTISHAIAQSVKVTLFEGLIETTIDSTKHIPEILAETGKIHMSRKAINKKIGQLFIMRINVNLVSNVLGG
ncbi:hypothetical protein HK102_012223, partial [Quaeritorhiza haematococci]